MKLNLGSNNVEKYMHHILFCESYLRKCMGDANIVNIIKVAPNHPSGITLRGIYRENGHK